MKSPRCQGCGHIDATHHAGTPRSCNATGCPCRAYVPPYVCEVRCDLKPGELGATRSLSSVNEVRKLRTALAAIGELLARQRILHGNLIAPTSPGAPVLIEVARVEELLP